MGLLFELVMDLTLNSHPIVGSYLSMNLPVSIFWISLVLPVWESPVIVTLQKTGRLSFRRRFGFFSGGVTGPFAGSDPISLFGFFCGGFSNLSNSCIFDKSEQNS